MSEKTVKQPNYSDAMLTDCIAVYQAAQSPEDRLSAVKILADKHGKTVPSVRSKLAIAGVYIAKTITKVKSGRITKEAIVGEIATNANLKNDQFFESLKGANKSVLAYIVALQHEAMETNFNELDGDVTIS